MEALASQNFWRLFLGEQGPRTPRLRRPCKWQECLLCAWRVSTRRCPRIPRRGVIAVTAFHPMSASLHHRAQARALARAQFCDGERGRGAVTGSARKRSVHCLNDRIHNLCTSRKERCCEMDVMPNRHVKWTRRRAMPLHVRRQREHAVMVTASQLHGRRPLVGSTCHGSIRSPFRRRRHVCFFFMSGVML